MRSIEEIYTQYAAVVYRYLLSLTHNADIAEELTQETFYQAIRTSERYDGSSSVSTWLCAIAKTELKSYLRKHPRLEPLDSNAADAGKDSDPAEAADKKLEKLELLKKLHAVGEPYREVIYLRMYGELSFREIGQIHGRTENWARVTFYRGKELLKKELTKNE